MSPLQGLTHILMRTAINIASLRDSGSLLAVSSVYTEGGLAPAFPLSDSTLSINSRSLLSPSTTSTPTSTRMRAPSMCNQRLEIPQRLSILQNTETVWGTGHGKINFVGRGDLDEYSGVRPAFV